MGNTKTPKPRNAAKTKAAILTAAQQAFSDPGYSASGIRDIAAIADISSPLLLRYFGSKAGLLEAALIDAAPMDDVLAGDREAFGERLAAMFANPDLDTRPPAMIALSIGDAEARDITARVTAQHLIEPLAKWLGPPDGRARAIEIMMLSIGYVLCTRLLPLAATSKNAEKHMTKWLAQSLQDIVDKT